MNIGDRIQLAARTFAGRMAGRLGAFASATPIVPGIGNNFAGPYKLPQDDKARRILESREALYGRTTTNLGPVQSNISTHPIKRLTPARLGSIQEQVLTIGYMLDWANLCEDIRLTDAHVTAIDESGRVAVVGAPFSIEPADGSPEARAVADYQQAVVDRISGWDRAMKRLLAGNGDGYHLEEVVYKDKVVRFPVGDTHAEVYAPTPDSLHPVYNKQTRWQIGGGGPDGDLLELDCQGSFVPVPDWKVITYECAGDLQIRRRGWMYQAVWLSTIKQNAWARWGVMLDLWGVRSPWGKASPELWQDDKRKAEMLRALEDWGRGLPAIFTDDFTVEATAGISEGDTRGMHLALIGTIDTALSTLIQGEQLTTQVGGNGSFAQSQTHADTKETFVSAWEKNLSSCVRDWLTSSLRLACYNVDADGNSEGINPRGLSAALGISPERVYALCGRPYWRIAREITPSARMEAYVRAVNELGLEIDADSAYREFGFAKARHADHRLRGAPVPVAADAAAVSTTDALDGVDNPKPEAAPAVAKRKRLGRSKRT